MWSFSDVSGTNPVPTYRVLLVVGRTEPATPWRWGWSQSLKHWKTFTPWRGCLSEKTSLTVCGYQQFGWANWESRGYVTGFVSPGIMCCAVCCRCRWNMLRNYKRWHILWACGRWKVREVWSWADSSHRCKLSSMFRTTIVLKGGWSMVLEKGQYAHRYVQKLKDKWGKCWVEWRDLHWMRQKNVGSEVPGGGGFISGVN